MTPTIRRDESVLILLRFVSPVMPLGLIGNPPPQTVQYNGWTLQDQLGPPLGDGYPADVVAYQMLISRALGSGDQSSSWHAKGTELIELIERLWAFGTGMPAQGRGFAPYLANVSDPLGWTSNVGEVENALSRARGDVLTGRISVSSLHWRHVSVLPTSQVLPVLTAFETADELVRELVELHFAAHAASACGRAFHFAKGLEIVRGGRNVLDLEEELQDEVRSALPRTLGWFFTMANTRRETRHPITKIPQVALHPAMSHEERRPFLEGADLLIRSYVCSALGVPLVIPA